MTPLCIMENIIYLNLKRKPEASSIKFHLDQQSLQYVLTADDTDHLIHKHI